MKLEGKRVLITGGAVRVGAALARTFAGVGCRVVIHCRRSVGAAHELLRALPGDGHAVVAADLADPAGTETLFDRIGGQVDILVNNASLFGRPAENADPARAPEFLQVNFLAPLALIRQMVRQPELAEGAVVNLLDQAIGREAAEETPYLRSRRLLAEETRKLALELAPRIRVNAVAPGPVLPPVYRPESRMERELRTVPLGRPVALGDLAAAVLFLAANASVTGEIMFVDGGQHLA